MAMIEDSLKGKKIIVTAAASGIGLAIAEAFDDAGAQVFVCDVAEGALADLARRRPTIGTLCADVAAVSDVDRLFERAMDRLGGLDVLVNNAGIAGPTAAVENIDPTDWDRTVAINLHGAFYGTRRAVPLLKAAGGGSVVNLSSAAGRLGFPLRTPYAAAKWAIVGFTQSLAMELGPFGIRVNALLPGPVEGARMQRVLSAKAAALGLALQEVAEQEVAQVSLRRMIPPQHIANMVLFICSDAGACISGQSLGVCGNTESLR